MKHVKRTMVCAAAALSLALSVPAGPALADTAGSVPVSGGGNGTAVSFTDVPADSWALEAIRAAKDYGLMKGQDAQRFGYGKTVSRAEFVTMLCNLMKWDGAAPGASSFSDVQPGDWYFPYIETALAHGVMDKTADFNPSASVTREDAAVMLVRALGLSEAAKLEEKSSALPFPDVSANKGYIAVAKSIGMISGTAAGQFNPAGTAKREEVAAMLTQIYARYYGKTDFLHGFYAISSYSQKELTKDMDAVTFMWSALSLEKNGVHLVTDGSSGSQYKIPDSYEDITGYLSENGVKAHLGVYMAAADGADKMLKNDYDRSAAVDVIMDELARTYPEAGENPYSGVTIDIEGLKGDAVKQGFSLFLKDLSSRLKALDKTLYVAVQPALPDGSYYDGFDYRAIGSLADKVILMAHDYNPISLKGYVGTQWHKNAALTPIGQVYYSLKAAVDGASGVEDKSKLVLAISFAGTGWPLAADGTLASPDPIQLSPQTISTRLNREDAETGFSEIYRNPWTIYENSENRYFTWYENSRSVFEKAALARLFGIDGVSLWRIGNIPNYEGYDVTDSYK